MPHRKVPVTAYYVDKSIHSFLPTPFPLYWLL